MQAEYEWSLGRFGDLRLDKRGRRCSGACFAPAVYASAGLPAAFGPHKWPFGAS